MCIRHRVYLSIQDQKALEAAILMIDGTKFEANANKMTFFWGAWVKRYRPRHWQKAMEIVRQLNRYFKMCIRDRDSCLIYGYQELSETQFQTMAQRDDVIVDCVFGFNFHAPLPDFLRSAFRWINQQRLPVDVYKRQVISVR